MEKINSQPGVKFARPKIELEELINPCMAYDCVGTITKIEQDTVYVDFKGNSFGTPLAAKLGSPFTLSDLKKALDHVLDVKLKFEDNDMEKPVITDIFYSIIRDELPVLQDMHIKGRQVILEGETMVVIKCGNVSTTFSAKDGRLVSEAVDIRSEAVYTNEIKGASIQLN